MKISDFTDDVVRSIGFLSRIPMPGRFFIDHDGSLSRAVRAFPVAGMLITLPPAALFALLLAGKAAPLLAAFIALALQTLMTGALHEDGLSDTADGIGGGRDRESALRIMKDSRIGSYGAVALILSFAIRGAALGAIADAASPTSAGLALVGLAFLAVVREGLESVFFLLAIFQQNSGWAPAIGAGLGIGLAAVIGVPVRYHRDSESTTMRLAPGPPRWSVQQSASGSDRVRVQ